MALLKILHFPDPRLRTQAKPVQKVDKAIQSLVANLFETMYQVPGVGLAATQVNIHKQIIVIDISEERNQPLCLINPKILASEGTQRTEEGCLSVPDIFEKIERSERITVQALNEKGESLTLTANEILSVCIQHEIDHLKGKLFVDYLSSLKRQRISKKLLNKQRKAA
ncbi:MAG: peptide deformylase [Candidatus Parabeggiatoa sp. nov. 3]|nr:MAG: peptide deformylase [Gammaproteobacteria bacterium]RKZ87828.1 MAG: peptide deformylase [Gammaproteobacteria bacterium]